MPNHITNIIEAPPHVLLAFTRQHTEAERVQHEKNEAERKERMEKIGKYEYEYEPMDMEKRFVDFGTVIPMPDNMEKGGCPGGADPVTQKHSDGTVCWYEWNRIGWGTKWNAYDQEGDPNEGRVQFDTAWAHPEPVIEALSRKFPDDDIHCKWADEDLGNNLGEYIIRNGEVEMLHDEDERSEEENLEFACQIKYGTSYAVQKAVWDADEIEWARKYAFMHRIEAQRGIENGLEVIRNEGLEIPQDIIDGIQTIEDTENYKDPTLLDA